MKGSAARWSLAALVVVVALVFAIWPRGEDPIEQSVTPGVAQSQQQLADRRDDDTADNLAPLRDKASLDPCPTPSPDAASDGPLAGVVFECIGDGSSVDLGRALAGKPALINLWAYWCEPCAREMPHLQEYADSVSDRLTVITAHQDLSEARGLARLADFGVTLPGVQDGNGRIAAAVGAPIVLPVSILIDADGKVAKVLPQPFDSIQEIDDAVRTYLDIAI